MKPAIWKLCVCGAGNVGGGLLAMLHDRQDELARRYGADFRVCGVAEEGGSALDPAGLDLGRVLAALRAGEPLGLLPGVGRPGMTPARLVADCAADVLLEATPVSLTDGEPGLGTVRAALTAGMHVVLANKGPLALAYPELAARSDLADGWGTSFAPADAGGRRPPRLRFSATVAGALPVVNIGRRDLAGDSIIRIEAVLNGTSQSILRAMESGTAFEDALAQAQENGIAETDPSLDIDGHDAACKLVITANAVLGMSATLADVDIEGIRGLAGPAVAAWRDTGQRLILLCLAEQSSSGYHLSVRPRPVPGDHPLARLTPDEMGVVFYTSHVDRLHGASLEPGPGPASAAMLRDLLDIVWSEPCRP